MFGTPIHVAPDADPTAVTQHLLTQAQHDYPEIDERQASAMTLQAGDKAPDFTLQDDTGTARSLSEFLQNGPVVLFFYPAANTPGCTAEACHFRDLAAEFAVFGAQRLGISVDDVASQKSFTGRHGFDYPLLADVGGAVAGAYGVKRGSLMGKLSPVKRATFVIGKDGEVKQVITSETRMNTHADTALEALARR